GSAHLQRKRRNPAGAGKRPCSGRRQALCAGQSRPQDPGVLVWPRGQGHAHAAEDTSGGKRPRRLSAIGQGAAAMKARELISEAIRSASAAGEPALIAFLTAGYPSRERFREHLHSVADGADVVEIGVPFTDPMADGVTIQRSSEVALSQGVSLRWILKELQEIPAVSAPLLLMSYLNPLLAYGLNELAHASARARVSGFIVPDLPYDEGAELRQALDAHGIAMVQMVTPVTRAQRMQQ